MIPIEQIKLKDFFQLIKQPEYILGTTFTLSLAFFESVVFPCINRSRLKSCLIISDGIGYKRALTEGPSLRAAAQGYMVVPAPVSDCFHAKVWIVIGESELAILVGSGNLTQSGFMLNAELFDALVFSKEELPNQEIYEDIVSFVSGLSSMWGSKDFNRLLCIETLNRIKQALIPFKSRPISESLEPDFRFLHSFQGRLIDQLPDFITDDLYIASPFFGNSSEGINLLSEKYPNADLHIFPGVHNTTATDAPLSELKNNKKVKSLKTLALPKKKKKNAFAHLKLYGFKNGDGTAWTYCTSANCTAAAWGKQNVEAGILRKSTPETVDAYFIPGTQNLPDDKIHYEAESSDTVDIPIWAIDTGPRVDITVLSNCDNNLPLTDVQIEVRIGSNLYKAEQEELFNGGTTAHISWSKFKDLKRSGNITICLWIIGKNSEGKLVSGGCFVENQILLTADPIHRSAWKGALELLDTEALPNMSDISAIFTLVGHIFDGKAITTTPKKASAEDEIDKQSENDEDTTNHIAIWPPQSADSDLPRKIGSSGMGQLRLCQKILETFLKPESVIGKKSRAQINEAEGDETSSEEDMEKQQKELEEQEKQRSSLRDKIWKKAEDDYDRLCHKLKVAVPDKNSSKSIWVVSIMIFLATVSVRKKAVTIGGDNTGKIPSVPEISDSFLKLLLTERKQSSDFCCPLGMRYRRVPFPALANDLRKEFNEELHPDLLPVMLAIITDKKIRSQYPLTAYWPKALNQVIKQDYQIPNDLKEICLRIWHIYIQDDADTIKDEKFLETFEELMKIRERGE